MEIDLELKVKLFNEYLNNGGIERIVFPQLLESLLKVKSLPNGKVNPDTVDTIVNSAMLAYVGSQLMEPFSSDKYLSQYETLLQKSIFFTQTNIETVKEFDEIFEKYEYSENILFRGTNEAKYRLYSSLQREWITKKLYEKHNSYQDYLSSLVNNARLQEGGVLSKYFDKIGIDTGNDLAVLSFLQHYGCPTPLLDWTYSFKNALFFATQNIQQTEIKWEIEKYLCVYYLEEKFFERASMQQVFNVGLKDHKEKLKNEFFEAIKTSGVLDGLIDKIITPEHIDKMFYQLHGKQLMTYMTKIERLIKSPMLYFSDEKTDNNLKYCLNNSLNIVNQNGVFVWNSDPTKPIEQITFDNTKTTENRNSALFSKCININKELAGHIKKRITKKGITKKYIYPNAWKIAKLTYGKT
jgi:FRG domain